MKTTHPKLTYILSPPKKNKKKQVDATANDLPKSLGIRGFPTLLLFKGDGSAPLSYDGERDFAALSKYLTGKTGAKVRDMCFLGRDMGLYVCMYVCLFVCVCVHILWVCLSL
jgi:hypothetical protein